MCGPSEVLHSRSLDDELNAIECQRCVGLWLGHDAFDEFVDRASTKAQASAAVGGLNARPSAPPVRDRPGKASTGPAYRACVRCGQPMNRQNYGRRSGVIVDVCAKHGIWFDAHELDRIIGWVRKGGLAESRKKDKMHDDMERERERLGRRRGSSWNSLAAGISPRGRARRHKCFMFRSPSDWARIGNRAGDRVYVGQFYRSGPPYPSARES